MSLDHLGSSLSDLIKKLQIPADYARVEHITEAPTLLELDNWKQGVHLVLDQILRLVQTKSEEELSLEDQGHIIFASSPFAIDYPVQPDRLSAEHEKNALDSWTTDEARQTAQDLLALPVFSSPSRQLLEQVLASNLKPIFKSSPHPHLHSDTGRKLSRAAGGPMAMQDYYEGQRWKEYQGIGKVCFWCVCHVQSDSYEHMWHLLIPPVITLLDDYEVRFKLQGVFVVQQMLQHVPKGLMKRTGINGLIHSSLRNSLSHLQNAESPQLLRSAISTSVSLILLSTTVDGTGSKPSSERFDQLCALLGEGIISGIWLYAEDKPEVVLATFDSLPQLLRTLGIGTVRFLKALLLQLTHPLIPRSLIDPDREMQLSALGSIEVILDVCAPRINFWKETILNAIGKCWVQLIDEEQNSIQLNEFEQRLRSNLKLQLQRLCAKLAEEEYKRFMEVDQILFKNLFAFVPGTGMA
ncbi:hypothetical protein BYT27DRAFT_7232472 [Phlegmacium glaucopus]|nr:hypothetical protein BYT27DRAFT_7232472 [Phlegmacium glaucopus]